MLSFAVAIIQRKNEHSYPSIVDTQMAQIEYGWHQSGKVLIYMRWVWDWWSSSLEVSQPGDAILITHVYRDTIYGRS